MVAMKKRSEEKKAPDEIRIVRGYKLEYFRYTEKGEGRPKGRNKVGDKVKVNPIDRYRKAYFGDTEIVRQPTIEGTIVQITYRIKHNARNADGEYKGWHYRDSFYKVQVVVDGKVKNLWINGGFNWNRYHDSEQYKAQKKKAKEDYKNEIAQYAKERLARVTNDSKI